MRGEAREKGLKGVIYRKQDTDIEQSVREGASEGTGRIRRTGKMDKRWGGRQRDSSGVWFLDGLMGGGSGQGKDRHSNGLQFLRRSSVAFLCLSLMIISFSGVMSLRLLTTSTTLNENRELRSERDPSTPFRLGTLITDWDEQRAAWLEQHPHMKLSRRGKPRLFMITGSPAEECANPIGDFMMLKAAKNKMDYCRLHDIDSYYNMAVMDSAMLDFWTKLPLVRNIMLTHPEAEWVWWIDSDAVITDMKFEIPQEKYEGYNMVIHGWPKEVFENKNWVGLNAGIYLLRNCQWTLDFLDLWGAMGEDSGNHRLEVGKMLTSFLPGRIPNFPSDDQCSLVYLLNTMKDTVYPKVYLESSYYLHGFWLQLTEKFEEYMANGKPGYGDDRWPFVTHFVGCKLCGNNNDYPTKKCLKDMNRAFNLADNQVLADFGLEHISLQSSLLRLSKNANETVVQLGRLAS